MISKPWTLAILYAVSPRFLISPIHYHGVLSVYRLSLSAFIPLMTQIDLPGLLIIGPRKGSMLLVTRICNINTASKKAFHVV